MTESRLSVSDVRASTDSTNYPRIPRPASKMSDRGSKLFSWLMTKKTKIGVMPMHNDTKNASAAPQFGNHQKHFIPPSSPLPSEPVTSTITILESEPTTTTPQQETTLKKPQHQKPESRVLEYFAKRAGGGNQTDVSVQHSREQISQIVNGVALNSKDQQQQTLVLKDCRQLLNSDVLALAHALASNTHLTELDLSNTRTSTAAAIELAKALEKNCTLRVLNLERNLIGPQGMQALAASLAVNKTLNVLKLDGQYLDMDMDTEAVLASAVLKNSSLTGITVSLRDASARKQLFYAIQSNRSQVAP